METKIKDSMAKKINRNIIVAIKAPNGRNKTKREDVEFELLNYFQNFLTEPKINREV